MHKLIGLNHEREKSAVEANRTIIIAVYNESSGQAAGRLGGARYNDVGNE